MLAPLPCHPLPGITVLAPLPCHPLPGITMLAPAMSTSRMFGLLALVVQMEAAPSRTMDGPSNTRLHL